MTTSMMSSHPHPAGCAWSIASEYGSCDGPAAAGAPLFALTVDPSQARAPEAIDHTQPSPSVTLLRCGL